MQHQHRTALLAACAFFGLTGCAQHQDTQAPSDAATAQPAAPPASQPAAGATGTTTDFPARTVLGELDLPVYPTPKANITVNPTETNAAGERSESTSMDPHASFDDVVAWYKARMPGDSYRESPAQGHASFQIGKDGDSIIRSVIIDHISGHVQTNIILMRKSVS